MRNLPVLDESLYDHPSISTRFDLGGTEGTPTSFFDTFIDYSPTPLVSFSGGTADTYSVTSTAFAAGGVDVPLYGYLPGPDVSTIIFERTGESLLIYQVGHPNVQAAEDQCAPAAVANSLDWLRENKGLPVKQENIPGIRDDVSPGDKSLVGALEKAMNRGVRSALDGDGVWPWCGKLTFLNDEANGLEGKLINKKKNGADVTWGWIASELAHGEDVELDLHYNETGGRHYVEVTGAGMILGIPFITHVSDNAQTDVDTTNTKGTDKVEFEWMIGTQALNSNAEIDEVISESVPEPPTLALTWPVPAVSIPGCPMIYRVTVQNSGGSPAPPAPVFIDYYTNAKANLAVRMLPSDSAGVPTGDPAVFVWARAGVDKGRQRFVWPGDIGPGVMAPAGYYVARITATSTPTRWDANVGLYINWQIPGDPRWRTPAQDEWGYRDSAGNVVLPSDTAQNRHAATAGFYGVGINRNPNSLYYGRIYTCHKGTRDIYMYDVDGSFLGPMGDAGVTWGESAPWDLVIADDDYVYVSDRSEACVYCFMPDGSGLTSKSGTTAHDRAIGGGWVDTAGKTHIYVSSGSIVYETTVAPDRMTWSACSTAYTPDSSDGAYGMCMDNSHTIMYQACVSGGDVGVRKWTESGGAWTKVGGWAGPKDSAGVAYGWGCADVDIASYDTAGAPATLWASRHVEGSPGDDVLLVNAVDGKLIQRYDIAEYPLMICATKPGNVLVGFGKSTTTWPSMYLGEFSTPGTFTKSADTSVFCVTADPAPVLVPGSEQWTYGDASGELIPDDTNTAEVSFQVIDANGFSDIGAIQLDLKELRDVGEPTIVSPDSVTQNAVNPLIADCTLNVMAREGVQYGTRAIGLKAYDIHNPLPGSTTGTFRVSVAGNELDALITHTRTGATIPDAVMKCVGGKPGVYGFPFTYYSAAGSDVVGYASCLTSEGTFLVTAEKMGFKTQAAKTIESPTVAPGAAGPPRSILGMAINVPGGLQLGPLTVAEARTFANQTVYASIEGLTYARPKGIAPTACTGQDDRLDQYTNPAVNSWGRMWYMCDPWDPTAGMQFQLKTPDLANFNRQWDDTGGRLPAFPFTSTYIGKRPDSGETICATGWLETRPGYETRLWVDDVNLAICPVAEYERYYSNLTDMGIEPAEPLPTPVPLTIAGISHDSLAGYRASWGKYGRVQNATVVAWMPLGQNPEDGTDPAESMAGRPNKYVIIADSLGNWTTVSFQSPTSLGLPLNVCPVDVGDTYTFTGAVGRHSRFSVGTLRVRGASDMVKTDDRTPPAGNSVDVVRGVSSGWVEFRGIVTAKFASPSCIYVENADRSVGIRVTGNPAWVRTGDEVWVKGDVVLLNGIKRVIPSRPIVVQSSGNALPYLGMRLHDVGGKDYDVSTDPGITDGRGPLNVGLFVTVNGMVTYRDTAATPTFFYIWDGSNMVMPGEDSKPLQDGSTRVISVDNNGDPILDEYGNPTTIEVPVLGTRIANGGYLSVQGRGVKAWQDWVEIEGVVSVNQGAMPGKTIPEIIPTSITLRTSFDTIAAAEETVIKVAGANLMCLPSVPAKTGNSKDYQYYDPLWNLTPGWDDNPMAWEAQVVLSKEKWDISNMLSRWETANQSQYRFDEWSEPFGMFGGLLLGDGYWVYPGETWGETAISYSGVNKDIPQWIATGVAGWMQIGHPQAHSSTMPIWNDNGTPLIFWDDFLVTDVYMSNGAAVYSIEDASPRNMDWLATMGYYWINDMQGQPTIGCEDDFPDSTTLSPWAGYVFNMHSADKAWIIY